MKQTLLLCFAHGFKGGDDAFHDFPKDLQKYFTENAKDLNVQCATFPIEEPPGELAVSAKAFREWLDKQVQEQENETEQGSVGVILIGHSTGGLVVTDAFLSILDQQPDATSPPEPKPIQPPVHGILTFDTPFCGLSRSMFAYGTFAQYKVVADAYSQLSAVGQLATFGSQTYAEVARAKKEEKEDAPEGWRAWQEAAMRTSAATGAASVLAGIWNYRETLSTGLSYLSRDSLGQGWSSLNRDNVAATYQGISVENMDKGLAYMSQENVGHGLAWISVHLQFVAALMRGDELTARLERMNDLEGIGFKNLYASMGPNTIWSGSYFAEERTFCSIPAEGTKAKRCFQKEINIAAKDEINAHISMFDKTKNTSYEGMTKMVGKYVVEWNSKYDGKCIDHYRIEKTKEMEAAAKKEESAKDTDKKTEGTKEEGGKQPDGQEAATESQGGWLSYLPSLPFSSAPAPEVKSESDKDKDTASAAPARAETPATSAAHYGFSSYLPGIPFYSTTSASTSKEKGAESNNTPTTETTKEKEPAATDEPKAEPEEEAPTTDDSATPAANEPPEVADQAKSTEDGDDEETYAVGKVDAEGNVIDEDGEVIGKVSEEAKQNLKELEGKIVDEDGDILDEEGNVLGSADPVDEEEAKKPDDDDAAKSTEEKPAEEEAATTAETEHEHKPETTPTPANPSLETEPETDSSQAKPKSESEAQNPTAPPPSYAQSLMRYFWSDNGGLREAKVPDPNSDSSEGKDKKKGEGEGAAKEDADAEDADSSHKKRDGEVEVDMTRASIPGVTEDLKVK